MDDRENIKIRLGHIVDKLEKLKGLDKEFSIFGSDNHRYELNSILTKEDIEKYEKKNNIILPEEYAQFIMHVGDGGVGPCYGLLPLEENENMIKVSEVFPYDIEHPFYILDKYCEFYDQMDKCETSDEEDSIYEEKDKIVNTDYENSTKGIIDLCHEGCAMYNVLIVNGKDNGTIWFFDFANDLGVIPLMNSNNGRPMGFLDWYELWLDEQIKFMESNSEDNTQFGSYISYIKQNQ